MRKYTTVYITSDIHADVRRFLDVLIREEIIGRLFNSTGQIFNPFSDDIYNTEFIDRIKFNKANTLLLILGDLIHGHRDGDVNDKVGNFELLLHVIIFNLRIHARTMKSEILFTLGNHDYHHLFTPPTMDRLIKFSHSLNYFKNNTIEDRFNKSIQLFRDALIPFYNLSPYIMLNLQYNGENEFSCIHAGFHNNTEDITTAIEGIQQKINIKDINELSQLKPDEINTLFNGSRMGGLWTRSYADNGTKCIDLKNEITTIVVGHCPTQTGLNFHRIENILTQKSYEGCDGLDVRLPEKGCVVADCYDTDDKRPKLIFVDTMMSDAFRGDDKGNATRNVEVLMLEHTDQAMGDRWITKISRKLAGDAKIPLWGSGELLEETLPS